MKEMKKKKFKMNIPYRQKKTNACTLECKILDFSRIQSKKKSKSEKQNVKIYSSQNHDDDDDGKTNAIRKKSVYRIEIFKFDFWNFFLSVFFFFCRCSCCCCCCCQMNISVIVIHTYCFYCSVHSGIESFGFLFTTPSLSLQVFFLVLLSLFGFSLIFMVADGS